VSEAGPPLHRVEAEALLEGLFRLMDYPARLDFKDLPDGALGVAVHFEGELPGVQPGKRSYLVDCIQFLVNKAVNRPNLPRRWVNLGVDAFPEPRGQGPGPRQPEPSGAAPASAPSPVAAAAPAARAPAPARAARNPQPARAAPPKAPPPPEAPAVAEDPTWTRLGQSLAERSARLGRVYGVMLLSSDDRVRLQRAAQGVAGVNAKLEGDGHWRRVVLTPPTVTPLVKKHVMPDWDDDEA